ncbi:hypothetical protein MTR67_025514 [Solanum verrucosum]|uniref:non-specific serine/threonine protein kinase n=1 Tax=Solanum verrucosum TaxID=315347 RepID=A0AAF0QXB1_SOLVR|nr:hypothetical protein MTR67_025514 [Solanum verrucosum]
MRIDFTDSVPESNFQHVSTADDRFCTKQVFRKLRSLWFNENALDGDLSASAGNFSNSLRNFQGNGCKLQEFYLHSNEIKGNVTSLRYLNLAYNRLNLRLPTSLGDLHDLIEFNVSSNSLSDHIPLELGNLKAVTLIDLSKNDFSGKIPSTLGGLAELINLPLAHNRLEGPIPDSFGKLLALEFLDLSYNNFSGEIPKSLEALVYLKYINFSFNKLSGEIPIGGPFANVTSQSFLSNDALCGDSRDWVALCVGSWLCGVKIEKDKENASQADVCLVFNVQLEGAFKSFDTECEILRNLRHRNLTKVITSCANLDFKALVLEYMPNGTLTKWLYSPNLFLNLLQRLDIMIDVASAMDYLHNGYTSLVVHCDLKPSNVLLDQEMVGHVSDFGIAKLLGEVEASVQTRTIATIGYIAPEYGQDGIVSTRCDVYSFGILMMETFTRKRPSDDTFTGEWSIQRWLFYHNIYSYDSTTNVYDHANLYHYIITLIYTIIQLSIMLTTFTGEWSIQRWVSDSFPSEIHKVVDSNLVQPGDEQIDAKMQCLLSIVKLALNCTLVTPDARISMKDALSNLIKIRLQLVNCRH